VKEGIIIYGSCYGSSQRYAQALSDATGLTALPYQAHPDLSGKAVVVYVGGLYAEKVMGMAKTLKNLGPDGVEQLIIATVGIGDPAAPETAAILQKSLKSQIPPALLEKAHIFHLRGDIDYDKLKPRHKMMMGMFRQALEKMPEEKSNDQVRIILDTYGKKASYLDLNTLAPVTACVQAAL
jgi:hypothetical protein